MGNIPRFDRYVSILAYPAIQQPVPLVVPTKIPQVPVVAEYLRMIKTQALPHLQALTDIVTKSGEPLEESIMTTHFSSQLVFNMRQVDLCHLSKLCSNILNVGFNAGHSTVLSASG